MYITRKYKNKESNNKFKIFYVHQTNEKSNFFPTFYLFYSSDCRNT